MKRTRLVCTRCRKTLTYKLALVCYYCKNRHKTGRIAERWKVCSLCSEATLRANAICKKCSPKPKKKNTQERDCFIERRLKEKPDLTYFDLSKELNISEDTVARIVVKLGLQRKRRSKRYFNAFKGWIETSKAGKLYYRSSYEKDFIEQLEQDSNIVEFWKDKVKLPYTYNGKQRNFLPDFLIRSCLNELTLVEIKPSVVRRITSDPYLRQQQEINSLKFEVARNWAREKRINFEVKYY